MDKKRIAKLDNLFITSLNNNVFPCAGMAFSKWKGGGYQRVEKYYGLAQEKPVNIELTKDHFFDLASLTKPLSTVLLLLTLFEKRIISPNTELGTLLPHCSEEKKRISIQNLMSHSAGFIPHREYFKELIDFPEEKRKEILLERILEEKLEYVYGEKHRYSDIGYMLLGLLIEKITDKNLGEAAEGMIYRPLRLEKELCFPGLHQTKGCAYVNTEKCIWDEIMLSGRVHDDNCRVIGGMAGHAGLFGTLKGVMGLCEKLLDQWRDRDHHPGYSNVFLKETLKRVGNSNWTMGFDMVSEQGSSSGTYFSKESVGHLGFTGTSFWIDPIKGCIAVLLSNRVYYGRDNWKIREFRPAFHDFLMG